MSRLPPRAAALYGLRARPSGPRDGLPTSAGALAILAQHVDHVGRDLAKGALVGDDRAVRQGVEGGALVLERANRRDWVVAGEQWAPDAGARQPGGDLLDAGIQADHQIAREQHIAVGRVEDRPT